MKITSRFYDLNPNVYNLDPNLDPDAAKTPASKSRSSKRKAIPSVKSTSSADTIPTYDLNPDFYNLDPAANGTVPLSISTNSLSV